MPKFIPLLAACGLLASLTVSASAKIDRVIEKSFSVQPGVHLRVSTSGGEVRVVSSTDTTVRVVAKEHIRASSEADADEVLKNLNLVIEQHGNDVVATASYSGGLGFHFGSWPPVQVDFVVTVPVLTSVDLRTSGGDIVVGNLDGTVVARTSGGGISLGKMGSDVDAATSGGNVDLVESRGTVTLSTSGGSISAGRIGGPADLKTSGGDIKVDSVQGTIDAHTSGGSVQAGIEGPLKGDCSLSTSGGDVRVNVVRDAAFHLDASTSGGNVNADGLTITIDHGGSGKSSLAGSVNGGGPLLMLRSSGGDIDVVTGPGRS